jgi:tRNA threonylcarbamoyladenosine biosynthesis protein TsaB
MLILGIETSTPVSSVAIGSEQGVVAGMTVARGRGHVEFLVPAVEQICAAASVSKRSLAGIAVGLGPGLFTGMRVGIATAKAMAQALSIPVVGVASLDLLAFEVRHSSKLICACVDARRSEVFAAFYRQVPGGVQRRSEFRAWSPDRLAGEIEARGEDVLFVGNGALLYRSRLPEARSEFASVSRSFPSATALVELALPRFVREEADSVWDIGPLYVRQADVNIGWEQRGVTVEEPYRVTMPPPEEIPHEGNGGGSPGKPRRPRRS